MQTKTTTMRHNVFPAKWWMIMSAAKKVSVCAIYEYPRSAKRNTSAAASSSAAETPQAGMLFKNLIG